jgi:hypothetical protein
VSKNNLFELITFLYRYDDNIERAAFYFDYDSLLKKFKKKYKADYRKIKKAAIDDVNTYSWGYRI